VLRDWGHLDFTAVPFLDTPSYRLTLADVLAGEFSVVHTAVVRHPADQWLSLQQDRRICERLDMATFLLGYRCFAEQAAAVGYIRYEDFTRVPDQELSALCQRLIIPYDSTYKARCSSYDKFTGDPYRNATSQVIQPGKRKQIDAALDKELSVNPDYLRALQLLGYQHVDQAGRK